MREGEGVQVSQVESDAAASLFTQECRTLPSKAANAGEDANFVHGLNYGEREGWEGIQSGKVSKLERVRREGQMTPWVCGVQLENNGAGDLRRRRCSRELFFRAGLPHC